MGWRDSRLLPGESRARCVSVREGCEGVGPCTRYLSPGVDVTNWLDDPHAVAEEYASDAAFRQRTLAFAELLEGPDEEEIVRSRILAARPRRLLDVGSGLGDLCA